MTNIQLFINLLLKWEQNNYFAIIDGIIKKMRSKRNEEEELIYNQHRLLYDFVFRSMKNDDISDFKYCFENKLIEKITRGYFYLGYDTSINIINFLFDNIDLNDEKWIERLQTWMSKRLVNNKDNSLIIIEDIFKRDNIKFKIVFEKKLINIWCKFKFDINENQEIENFVFNNSNKQEKEHFFINALSSTFDNAMSLEDLFQIDKYKNILKFLTKSEFKDLSEKAILLALERGDYQSILFWNSLYVKLPTNENAKKSYGTFAKFHFYGKNHEKIMKFIKENVGLTVCDHILLRSFISNKHLLAAEETLYKYKYEEIKEIKKYIERKKRYKIINEDFYRIYNNLYLNGLLNDKIKTEINDIKIVKV